MPPKLPLRVAGRRKVLSSTSVRTEPPTVCFFCSLGARPVPDSSRRPKRRSLNINRRLESTTAVASGNPRKDLADALSDLQKHASSYVNISRVQLALSGLRQTPGNESIRVAILGLTNGSESGKTAKQVLKLLLADPLKSQEEWETELENHNLSQPMIVRVGAEGHQQQLQQHQGIISLDKGSLLHEVHVSSATLNGHSLELLLMDTNPFSPANDTDAVESFEQSVLVPTVDIPTSSTGRYTPITTPVHKALVVADGIMGAASVTAMPTIENEFSVASAVNLPGYKASDATPLPFTPIDTEVAQIGLGLIRKDIGKAMEFEQLWFQSRMPQLTEWLKADVLTAEDGKTKAPVKGLIASILANASAAIESEQSRRVGSTLSAELLPSTPKHLQKGLEAWAQHAHTELQEQLDLAFSSKRWQKLSWWKLFWRVDDVGMLTTDILSQRFLTTSERNAIFLSGQMKEAGVPIVLPKGEATPSASSASTPAATIGSRGKSDGPSWPVNIPRTRNYLQSETIPRLQALAQNLVLQTLSTSGLTSALGALAYFGTLTTTVYEAGAVAALGIVWSMQRMQKKWETAREFWEGEVREEGRKAVRGVENVVSSALTGKSTDDIEAQTRSQELDELKKADELVQKAQEALKKLE